MISRKVRTQSIKQHLIICHAAMVVSHKRILLTSELKFGSRKQPCQFILHASPKLAALPPTEAAFRPNILRGHYQTAIWRSCASQDPPQASPEDYGWYRTEQGQMLPKKFTSEDVNVAPLEVMKLIRCQCHALSKRCEGRCSCKEAGLRCTSFCGCNDDGVFCSRFQDIADVSPDAYADIGNIIDNSNSDSEDDFDDF